MSYDDLFTYKHGFFTASSKKSTNFIKAVLVTGATITCSSCLTNGFPPEKANYYEFNFAIKIKKDQIKNFETIAGLTLKEPTKIAI